MRQILYISTSTLPGDEASLNGILEQSRHNNAIDGVTGLLWADGVRFMQVIEGPEESVAMTWARIQADPRHHDITALHDKVTNVREFGYWTMAYRHSSNAFDEHDAKLRRLVAHASPTVGEAFLAMIASEGV